ncbi:MAG: hypothetical protein ING65_17965 [Rhodocyclaceae bacterium]|jgi:hypothetical protein|nr:hypothetical protein [Rhodocyclaceae bacterium]
MVKILSSIALVSLVVGCGSESENSKAQDISSLPGAATGQGEVITNLPVTEELKGKKILCEFNAVSNENGENKRDVIAVIAPQEFIVDEFDDEDVDGIWGPGGPDKSIFKFFVRKFESDDKNFSLTFSMMAWKGDFANAALVVKSKTGFTGPDSPKSFGSIARYTLGANSNFAIGSINESDSKFIIKNKIYAVLTAMCRISE